MAEGSTGEAAAAANRVDGPGLRYVTAPPGVLDQVFVEDVVALRARDPLSPVHVLVGQGLQRPFLSRWLAETLATRARSNGGRATGAHANVRFLMPSELGLLLGAPALLDEGRQALPPLADRVLLAEVARAHEGYFEAVGDTPGFAEALYQLVRELKGAGLDVSELGDVLRGCCDAEAKDAALPRLLADFEARRRDFYGPDDALLRADPERLDGLGLLCFGLWEAPHRLTDLLANVAQRMPVVVYLPVVGTDADEAHVPLRERLEASGARAVALGGDEAAPGGDADRGGAGGTGEQPAASTLARARRRIFHPPAGEELPDDGTLGLVSAPDPTREVREAVRRCLAWSREGVPLWDMAIVYRHGDEYRPLIEAAATEAGLPVYLHEGSPLAERPLGRQVLGLLRLYEDGLTRQAVMDFLTDARLPDATRDAFDRAPVARWDSVSREAGVVAGIEQWRSRLQARAGDLRGDGDGEGPEWARRRIADLETLRAFMVDLDARLGAHPERATWAEHLDFLAGLLGRYIEDPSDLLEALRGLERFSALEETVGFERFRDTVIRAVETLRSEEVLGGSRGSFRRRGVNVIAVYSTRHLSFARTWILGALERQFPPPARQDPILLDDERRKLSAASGRELPLRAERGPTEMLEFQIACEAARERLVVSHPRTETGSSRQRLPSVFYRELAGALEGRRVAAEEASSIVHRAALRIPGHRIGSTDPDLALSLAERDRSAIEQDPELGFAALARAVPRVHRGREAVIARFAHRLTEWDGALGPEGVKAARQLRDADHVFSATGLEDYAGCPQRYLLAKVLRIKAVEEPERVIRMDNLRRGNLFHRIFERFYEEAEPGSDHPAFRPEAEERLRAIAEEECDAAEARGETGYPAMWNTERVEVIEDALRWLDSERSDPQSRAFSEHHTEARFGRRLPGEKHGTLSTEDPIEISPGGARLRLNGRIDRLDTDPETGRFRVTDYKTGKARGEPGRLEGGRHLQLPLYILAAAELLDSDPGRGSAAYDYATRRGNFARVEWGADVLSSRKEAVDDAVERILTGMRSGDFQAHPAHGFICDYICDFKDICAIRLPRYLDRKSGDPRGDALRELREIE